MALKLMYITNNPRVALIAERYGVDRIWVDLEILGKEERQHHLDTVKSKHTIGDIKKIAPILTKAELLVRVNPWNTNSVQEIESVIEAGAQIIMLPMWKTPFEVSQFVKTVNGRCKTMLLLETREAETCLDNVLALTGIDEIHIGLNDLHLSYGLSFMFELLSNGTVERICTKIKGAGIPFGFGGVACLGEGELEAQKILMEHYRMGSSGVILSRSFCNPEKIEDDAEFENILKNNLKELREYEKIASMVSESEFEKNRIDIIKTVKLIVKKNRG